MNYKLAKQLKDSGYELTCCSETSNHIQIGNQPYLIPTLSELIDACGEEFVQLYYFNGSKDWCASGGINMLSKENTEKLRQGTTTQYSEMGKTPEEAVAKLWLKLNV